MPVDRNLISLFTLLISLCSPLLSFADARNAETPTSLDGGKIVTAAEARQLQEEGKAFFADCRSVFNYGKGHIPGAKPVNYQHVYKKEASAAKPSLKKMDVSKLPVAKDTVIVFYSHGTTGWKSYKAAKAAIEAGYSQILWLRGGLQSWVKAEYPIEY